MVKKTDHPCWLLLLADSFQKIDLHDSEGESISMVNMCRAVGLTKKRKIDSNSIL